MSYEHKVLRFQQQANSSRNLSVQTAAWLPALLGVAVICCESTRIMGADHTMIWLGRLSSPLLHVATARIAELNHILRKSGHFFGYGTLGLVLLQGWLAALRTRTHMVRLRLRGIASLCAIGSVALVASLDELHQSFLPNRTACVSDVLLDTSGAVLLVALTSLWFAARRRRLLTRLMELRSTRRLQAGSSLFRSALLDLR